MTQFPFVAGDKLTADMLNSYRQNVVMKCPDTFIRNAGEASWGQDFSLPAPQYLWVACKPSNSESVDYSIRIFRFDRQSNGGYIYKNVKVTLTCTTSASLYGITETNGYFYVWYKNDTTVKLTRYDLDLTSPTDISSFNTTADINNSMCSDPTTAGKVWIRETTTTVKSYTISGTTATLVDSITLSSAVSANRNAIFKKSDGEIFIAQNIRDTDSETVTIKRYQSNGTALTDIVYTPCHLKHNAEWILGFGMIGNSPATVVISNLDFSTNSCISYKIYLIGHDLP